MIMLAGEGEGEGEGEGGQESGKKKNRQIIGLTWCSEDVLETLRSVVESYRTELFVKACVVDDVMLQTEMDVLLSYVATYLAEPYIDDNHIFAITEAAKYDLSNVPVMKTTRKQ